MHEKGLQTQKQGDGPLVSSQERRAIFVPRVNPTSTGRHPVVNRTFCSPIGSHQFSLVVLLRKTFRTGVSMPMRIRWSIVSWANRSVGVPSCPAPPRRTAVRRTDPTRLWYVRVLNLTNLLQTLVVDDAERMGERSWFTLGNRRPHGLQSGCGCQAQNVGEGCKPSLGWPWGCPGIARAGYLTEKPW